MEIFNLPNSCIVGRVVPKNAFDAYTNTRQKKIFTDQISRITWQYKLAPNTINLAGKEMAEIEIFLIELKTKQDIKPVMEIIDKSIPYPIIFVVSYGDELYMSASPKHNHPTLEDIGVIDWTFKTAWQNSSAQPYRLNLKSSLDSVYFDFCFQLSGIKQPRLSSLSALVDYCHELATLEKDIVRIKGEMKRAKQFNRKVELNIKLKEVEQKIDKLTDN